MAENVTLSGLTTISVAVTTNEAGRSNYINDNKNTIKSGWKYYLCRILIISSIGFACGILSYLNYGDLGRSVGIISFIMCLCMVFIITYDSAIAEQKRLDRKEITCVDKIKFIAQTTWKKKSLYFPLITHFADMSSDIAVIIEFYILSQDKNEYDINYTNLFVVSLTIFIFYRIITALLYLFFSHNKHDFFLQLFDLLIFKILYKSWELGLDEVSWIQQYISLLESLFESSIQALISIYVILKTGISNVSTIILISQLFSLISIANAQIKEDEQWFTPQSYAKQIEFKLYLKFWKKKYYTNKRILCCNWRYILRVLWRYIDICLRVIICGIIWIHFSGLFLICSFLFETTLFIIIGNYFGSKFQTKFMVNCEDKIELYLFAGLLSTLPNSAECTGTSAHSAVGAVYSWYRHIWNIIWVIIALKNQWENIVFVYVLCILCILNVILYINMTSRRMFACGNESNRCKPWERDPCLGFNWTHYELSTTRNLMGCRTLKQVKTLLNFGMNFHQNLLNNSLFWIRCLEPLQLLKYFETICGNVDELEIGNGTVLAWIGKNRYFTHHKQVSIMDNGNELEWDIKDYCDELASYLVNDLKYNTDHHFWSVLESTAWYQTNEYLLQSYIKNNVKLSRSYYAKPRDGLPCGIKWHIEHNTVATMEKKQIMSNIIKQEFDTVGK